MNITINLIINLQETVQNIVLSKILAVKRNNGTVNLTGNIYISAAYANEVLEFCTYFGLTEDENSPGTYRGNNIILSIGTSYISFQDNEVARIVNGTFGTDGHTTVLLAKNAVFTSSTFLNNTVILTFPEFNLFTKANDNPPDNTFKGCSNLTNIDLSQCTKFSNWEFRESGITAVNAPSLTSSGYSAFEWCNSLTNVLSLGSITSIPANMFSNCRNLLTVILPLGVTSVSEGGFENCYNLLTINGLRSVTSFGQKAFDHCRSLNITTADILNAVRIDNWAFDECLLLTGVLSLPNLISIGLAAFNNTRITSITNLGSISSLPHDAFLNCTSLTSVAMPSTCTSIGNFAFAHDSSLSSINLNNVTTFNNSCFNGCTSLSLTGSDILNAINIGLYAFKDVLLSGTLSLPSLSTINLGAFENTSITSIVNLGTLVTLSNYAFYNCVNLTSVTFPSTLRTVYLDAFLLSSILKFVIPEGVTTAVLGLYYTNNESLNYIQLPSTVTDMGIFFHRSLEGTGANYKAILVIKATVPPTLSIYGTESDETKRGISKFSGIYVPDSALSSYQNASGVWLYSELLSILKPISDLQTDNPTWWAEYLSSLSTT